MSFVFFFVFFLVKLEMLVFGGDVVVSYGALMAASLCDIVAVGERWMRWKVGDCIVFWLFCVARAFVS